MENNNIKEYKRLMDDKIPKETENHINNTLKNIYTYSKLYKQYFEYDEKIFNLRKDLGFKKRNLELLKNKLETLEKKLESNISSLIYLNDNQINFDFKLWLEQNEEIKKERDNTENKISKLQDEIEFLTKDEKELEKLIKDLMSDLKYHIILIETAKGKDTYINPEIKLKELVQIKTLVDNKEDKILLEKNFILSIKLKSLLYNYINNFDTNKIMEDKDIFDAKLLFLLSIGIDYSEEIDLEVMLNNPIFKDKVRLLEIIFNYFISGNLDIKDLEQFNHIKFVNSNNMWFTDLINILNDNNKNSNKIR